MKNVKIGKISDRRPQETRNAVAAETRNEIRNTPRGLQYPPRVEVLEFMILILLTVVLPLVFFGRLPIGSPSKSAPALLCGHSYCNIPITYCQWDKNLPVKKRSGWWEPRSKSKKPPIKKCSSWREPVEIRNVPLRNTAGVRTQNKDWASTPNWRFSMAVLNWLMPLNSGPWLMYRPTNKKKRT